MNQRVLCLKIGAENKGRQTSHIFYHVDPKASVSLWVSRKVLGTSYVFTLGRKVIGVEGREWVPSCPPEPHPPDSGHSLL